MPWSSSFDEPIELRGGRRLMTLQQAADYVMRLPDETQQQDCWQIAVENLRSNDLISPGVSTLTARTPQEVVIQEGLKFLR